MLMQGIKYNGMQADIWSCGVILYALIVGRLPFDDPNIKRLLAKVKSGVFTIPEEVPQLVRDLITKMIVVDADERITIEGIKKHPWFLSNKANLISSSALHQSLFATPLKYDNLDWEVITDLKTLGWGSEEDILSKLIAPERTIEKVYYLLYEKKKASMKVKPQSPASRPSIAIPNPAGRTASRSLGESSRFGSPEENSTPKPRSWFRNAFMRLTSKTGETSGSPHRGSCPDPGIEEETSPTNPSYFKPKDSVDESFFEGTPRFFRKKFLPEISSSPVASSSPKWSWFGFSSENSKHSIENLASSPPLSSSPIPTRKVSTSRTFGFVVQKSFEGTLESLFKTLEDLDIDCMTLDEYNYHCRQKEYHSVLEFKVSITNILDGTSHLVKFQRISDDLASYDLTFDRIQRLMKGPSSPKDPIV
eukprot:TRINITY_DN4397_c0_g1_i1.p1 TRINITY_DN4397_c0_g1~~TRINITY_DN4397_c0_g1_i1.p1  ORF type:complete len:420 (+),score=75.34 TRINITY_DN4397_c0_g1_i1:138-1397(+)